jgi:hypothetical protein
LLVLLAAISGWRAIHPSFERTAVRELGRGAEGLDYSSAEPARIRQWLRSETGVDVPLPGEVAAPIRLLGARIVRNSGRAAEVVYRVSGHDATLLVARMDPARAAAAMKHRFLKEEHYGSTGVSSWTMRGQLYTLAFSGSLDNNAGCILCHGAGGSPVLN